MDKFDQIIKASKLEVKPRHNLAGLVMQGIIKPNDSRWISRILASLLVLSSVFLLLSIFANSELRSLLSMLISDFDIVSSYPTDFLFNFLQTLPWLNIIYTAGIGLIAVWYFKRLKYYAS
jgi:hypothetical protein